MLARNSLKMCVGFEISSTLVSILCSTLDTYDFMEKITKSCDLHKISFMKDIAVGMGTFLAMPSPRA